MWECVGFFKQAELSGGVKLILHAVINHPAHVFLYMVGGRPYDIELKVKQSVTLRETSQQTKWKILFTDTTDNSQKCELSIT